MIKRISIILLTICFLSVASFTQAAEVTRTPLTENEVQTLVKAEEEAATHNTREIKAGVATPVLYALIGIVAAASVAAVVDNNTDNGSEPPQGGMTVIDPPTF